jgi:DUF4097 and DUF4098 domain-containing protein YvlB
MSTPRFALSLLLAGAALSAHAEIAINENRPLDPGGRLEVHNIAGRINVTAWDQPTLEIRGRLGEDVEKLEISGDRKGWRVEVKLPKRSGFRWWGGDGDGSAVLEIRAPANLTLDLAAVSADVAVRGHAGPSLSIETVSGGVEANTGGSTIALSSVSGDVRLTGSAAARDVELETVSGNIDARNVAGDLELETVSGDLDVVAGAVVRVHSESVSGDVNLQIGQLADDGRIDAETVSGDLLVRMPADAPVKLKAETFSGSIRTDFGRVIKQEHGPGERVDFAAGAGSARVELTAMSGGISVLRSQQ